MSHDTKSVTPVKAKQRPQHGPGRMGGGPHAGGTGEKAANFSVSARRLVKAIGPQQARMVTAIVLGVLSTAMVVVGPKILGYATDLLLAGIIGKQMPEGLTKAEVITQLQAQGQDQMAEFLANVEFTPGQGIDFKTVGFILLGVLTLFVLAGLLQYLQGWVLNDAVQRTIYSLRRQVSAKLDRLPLAYFDRQPRGEVLSRVTNDIDNISQTLQQTGAQLVNSLLMIVGVLIMMLWISPTLALVTILSVPVGMIVVGVIGKQSQKRFQEMWKSTGILNAHIEEAYSGHALVKVFGRAQQVQTEFDRRNAELYRSSFSAQFLSGVIMPVMFMVGNLSYVVIAVLGGLRVASGTMNIGDVQAFIQYSRQFTQPLTQVASMANLLQSGVASAERVFELLDAQEMSAEPTDGKRIDDAREVHFHDVSFSYTPDKPLIEHLNLAAQTGQTVAIVGPTGAGKTTVVNLLMRFYDLDGGTITLGGTDTASVPRAEVRRGVGMVLQDTWLFGGTIFDNIAYGRPDATHEEVIAAAKATFVDRFVHSLPDGYDTIIDEEGSNISAGEKQLITIARAFLADPQLLILDEATSSVDTRTELLVQQAMSALRKGRTSFVIAHRLSTIRDADLILVMEKGSIVEQGTHQQLLEAGGHYHDLYQAQFTAPAVEQKPEDKAVASHS